MWLNPSPDKETEEVEPHQEPKWALLLGVKEERNRGRTKEEGPMGGWRVGPNQKVGGTTRYWVPPR